MCLLIYKRPFLDNIFIKIYSKEQAKGESMNLITSTHKLKKWQRINKYIFLYTDIVFPDMVQSGTDSDFSGGGPNFPALGGPNFTENF